MEPEQQNMVSIFESPQETAVKAATVENPQYSENFREYLSTLDDDGKAEAIARFEKLAAEPETDEEIDQWIAQGYRYQFRDPVRAKKYFEYKAAQKGSLIKDIGDAIGMVPTIVGNALNAYKENPVDATLKTVPSAIEGFVQNARDAVGIFTQSSDPSSPFFKMKAYLSGNATDEELMEQLNYGILFNADSVDYAEGKNTILLDERFVDKDLTIAFATFLEPELIFPALGPIALPAAVARAAGYGAQVQKAALRVQKIKSAVIGGTVKWGVGKPAQFVGNLASGTIETVASKGAGLIENFTGVSVDDLNKAGRTAGLATASAHVAGYSIPYAGPIAATHLGGGLLAGFGQAVTETGEQMLRSQGHRGVLSFASQTLKDAGKNGVKLTKQGEMFLKLIDTFDPALSYAYHTAEGAVTGGAIGGLLAYGSQGEDGIGQGIGFGIGAGAVGGLAGRSVTSASGALRKLKKEVQAEFGIKNIYGYDPVTASGLESLKNHPAADARAREAINDLIVAVAELDHNAEIKVFGGGPSAMAEFALWSSTNLRSADGTLKITNSQFANSEGFTVVRDRDGRIVIGVNSDVLFSPSNKYGDHTMPHELLHAVTMASAIGPHFVSIGKDLIFGVRDANGKVMQKALVDVNEIREFMNQYREAETGRWNQMPEGPEREAVKKRFFEERALQESALGKLNSEPEVGKSSVLTIEEEAALGKYASEFLSYYFSAMFKETPMEFFLKGGKLDGIQNVLQIAKDAMRDHWEDRISFHEPRFNFFRNKGSSIDAGFYRDGKRVRIGALDYFIRDMLRANMEFKNRGVIDFSKMSDFTRNRLLESGAGSILIRDPKTGKVRSKTKKEVKDDNRQKGMSGYRVLEAMDKSLRRSITGADEVIRGDFSDAEFDALVQNGVLTPAEAQMGKLFQRTKDSMGSLPNVFESGILAASKQIEGLGDNDRVTGDRVPLTNRKFLLADVIMEYGKDGHFTMRVKTLDMRVIDRRKSIYWQQEPVRQLWDDSREAFENDFKRYLANASLPHNHPARVETARLFDYADGRGDARRDVMHQVAGFAKGEDKPYKNTPIAQIPRGTLMSVTDFSIPTMLNLRTTGESYMYMHANAFYDIAANFKPAAFKPMSGYDNIYENPLGYKVIKTNGRYITHGANGMHISNEDSLKKALASASSHFDSAIPAEREKGYKEHRKEVANFKVLVSKQEVDAVIKGETNIEDLPAIKALRRSNNESLEFHQKFLTEELADLYEELSSGSPDNAEKFKALFEYAVRENLTDFFELEGNNYYITEEAIGVKGDKQKRNRLVDFNELTSDKLKDIFNHLNPIHSGVRTPLKKKQIAIVQAVFAAKTYEYAKQLSQNGNGSVALLLMTSASDAAFAERALSSTLKTRSGGTSFATGEGHISPINRARVAKGEQPLLLKDNNGETYGQFAVVATHLKNAVVIKHQEAIDKMLSELKRIAADRNAVTEYVQSIYIDSNGNRTERAKALEFEKDGMPKLTQDEKIVLTDKWLLNNYKDQAIIKVSRLGSLSPSTLGRASWNYGSSVSILMPTALAGQLTAPLATNYKGLLEEGRVPSPEAKAFLSRRNGIGRSITDARTAEIATTIIPTITGSLNTELNAAVRGAPTSKETLLKPINAEEFYRENTVNNYLSSPIDQLQDAVTEKAVDYTFESLVSLVGTPSYERLKAFHNFVQSQLAEIERDPQYIPVEEGEYNANAEAIAYAGLEELKKTAAIGRKAGVLANLLTHARDKYRAIGLDRRGRMYGLLEDTSLAEIGTSHRFQEIVDTGLTNALWHIEDSVNKLLSIKEKIESQQNNAKYYEKKAEETDDSVKKDEYLSIAKQAKIQIRQLVLSQSRTEITLNAAVEAFREYKNMVLNNDEIIKSSVEKQTNGYLTVEMRERFDYHAAEQSGVYWDEGNYLDITTERQNDAWKHLTSSYSLDNFELLGLNSLVGEIKDVMFGKKMRATVVPSAELKRVLELMNLNSTQRRAEAARDKLPRNMWLIEQEPNDSPLRAMLIDETSELHQILLKHQSTIQDSSWSSAREQEINQSSSISKIYELDVKKSGKIKDYSEYVSEVADAKMQAIDARHKSLWETHAKESTAIDGGIGLGDKYLGASEYLASIGRVLTNDYLRTTDKYKEFLGAYKQSRDVYATNKQAGIAMFADWIASALNDAASADLNQNLFVKFIKDRNTAVEEFSQLNIKQMFVSELKDSFIKMFADSPSGIKPKVILQNIEKINSSGIRIKSEADTIGLLKFLQNIENARKGKPDEKVQLAEILEYLDKNSFEIEVADKDGILDMSNSGTKNYTLGGGDIKDVDHYGVIVAWIKASSPAKYFPHSISNKGHPKPQANAIVHIRYTERNLLGDGSVHFNEETQANNSQLKQAIAIETLKHADFFDRNGNKISEEVIAELVKEIEESGVSNNSSDIASAVKTLLFETSYGSKDLGLENGFEHISAELAFWKVNKVMSSGKASASTRLAYDFSRRLLESRVKLARSEIEANETIINTIKELMVLNLSGNLEATNIPYYFKEGKVTNYLKAATNNAYNASATILFNRAGVTLTDAQAYHKEIIQTVLTPEVVRKLADVVIDGLKKRLVDLSNTAHSHIEFSSLLSRAKGHAETIDRFSQVITDAISKTKFAIETATPDGQMISSGGVKDVILETINQSFKRIWSDATPSGSLKASAFETMADTFVKSISQQRDLKTQEAFSRGVLLGKVDPTVNSTVETMGHKFVVIPDNHYDRGHTSHVWGRHNPAGRSSKIAHRFKRLLTDYFNYPADLNSSLLQLKMELRNDSQSMDFADYWSDYIESSSTEAGKFTVPNGMEFDTSRRERHLAVAAAKMWVAMRMTREHGSANSLQMLADRIEDGYKSSTKDARSIAADALAYFYGDNFRRMNSVNDVLEAQLQNSSNNADAALIKRANTLIPKLSLGKALGEAAIGASDMNKAEFLQFALGVARQHAGMGTKPDGAQIQSITDAIRKHLLSKSTTSDSVNQETNLSDKNLEFSKKLVELAFQPSSEHRLLGIRMSIKRAQINGIKKVFILNPELSGSVSGLPIEKSRALYTKIDVNIAAKEAKRLGFKMQLPKKVMSYTEDALSLMPKEYADLVRKNEETTAALIDERIAASKDVIPKYVLKEGRAIVDGIDPDVQKVLSSIDRTTGISWSDIFTYADTNNNRSIYRLGEDRGNYIYSMHEKGPKHAIEKILHSAFRENNDPYNVAEKVTQYLRYGALAQAHDTDASSLQLRGASGAIFALTSYMKEKGITMPDSSKSLQMQFKDAFDRPNARSGTGFEQLAEVVSSYDDAVKVVELAESKLVGDEAALKVSRLAKAWLKEASAYATHINTLLSAPDFGTNKKGPRAIDLAASTMHAIVMPERTEYSPIAAKEFEEGTPFYKPRIDTGSPNDPPFKNDFFNETSANSPVAKHIKLYTDSTEDENKYTYTVRLKKLDGSNIDQDNYESQYMAVIDKRTSKATIMPLSTDIGSEYMKLARKETVARLGAFGARGFDEPNLNATPEPEPQNIGEQVAVGKQKSLNTPKEDKAAMKPVVSVKANEPPVTVTWNQKTSGYGTTLSTIDGYYIMAMNNKFRLYNAQQALIGVYASEEEAKRRAEAIRKKGKKS